MKKKMTRKVALKDKEVKNAKNVKGGPTAVERVSLNFTRSGNVMYDVGGGGGTGNVMSGGGGGAG